MIGCPVMNEASSEARKAALVYGEIGFHNQRGELLAAAAWRRVVAPLRDAASRGKYRGEAAYPVYSADEQRQIAADKAAGLELRGAEPRFFEDTGEGEPDHPHRARAALGLGDRSLLGGLAHGSGRFGAGLPAQAGGRRARVRAGPLDRRAHEHEPELLVVGGPRDTSRVRQRHAADVLAAARGHALDGGRRRPQAPQGEARAAQPVRRLHLLHGARRREARRGGAHLIECELRAHDQLGRTRAIGDCTIAQPFADLGADVYKVETRFTHDRAAVATMMAEQLNRGKLSVELDLNEEADRATSGSSCGAATWSRRATRRA